MLVTDKNIDQVTAAKFLRPEKKPWKCLHHVSFECLLFLNSTQNRYHERRPESFNKVSLPIIVQMYLKVLREREREKEENAVVKEVH